MSSFSSAERDYLQEPEYEIEYEPDLDIIIKENKLERGEQWKSTIL